MIATLQPELDTIANPRRRRELLGTYTDEDLETLRARYERWGAAFPSGVVRAHECADELERRRLAAEGE